MYTMKNGVLLLAPEGPAVEPVDGNTLAVQSTPIKGKPTTQAPEDPAMEPVDESTLTVQSTPIKRMPTTQGQGTTGE